MGWQDAPLAEPRPAWESAPLAEPQQARTADGIVDAAVGGFQNSVPALMRRGRLPDIKLSETDSKWYERLAHGMGQMAGDLPAMVPGLLAGGAAGTAVTPGIGTVVGAGFGAMAVPAAIREAYTQAYQRGEIVSLGDFLNATTIETTLKQGLIGGVTGGVGKVAGVASAGLPMANRVAATTIAEAGTATVAASALEDRMPHPQDFTDNALFILGLKGVAATPTAIKATAGKVSEIYRRTGKQPLEVAADAVKDPTIAEEIAKQPEAPANEIVAYHGGRKGLSEFADPDGTYKTAVFFTDEKAVAEAFAEKNGTVYESALDIKKPFVVDAQGAFYDQIALPKEMADYATTKTVETDLIAQWAFKNGYDGVVIKDVVEGRGDRPSTVYAIAKGSQAKIKPTPDIPKAYEKLANETAAAESLPSEKLKAMLDKPYADVPDVKLPEGLNLKYFENIGDLAAMDARATEIFKAEINAQRGGTQSNIETLTKAQELLRTAAGDEAVALVHREVGTADVAHVLQARGALMVQAMQEAKAAIDAWRGATEANKTQATADAMAALQRFVAMKLQYTGASAEAGRALQILKAMKDAKEQVDGYTRIMDAFNGKDPATVLDALARADSMAEASSLMDKINRPSFFDKYMDYRRSSLMSGYLTIARNTLGGGLMLGRNVMLDVYTALESKLTPGADQVPLSKAVGRVTGYLLAAKTMFYEAGRAYKEGETMAGGVKNVADAAWAGATELAPTRPLAVSKDGGVVEKATYYQATAVFGANTLIDGMMRNFGYYGEVYARAAEAAVGEGLAPGSKAFMDSVAKFVENPPEKAITAANKSAADIVFAGEHGSFMKSIAAAYNDKNFQYVLKPIIPFVSVPGKMFEQGFRASPFAILVKAWRDDVAAGGDRAARAHAEAALGRIAWATIFSLSKDEVLTGGGPPEPDKRRVWLETHQPYSIKIGNTWYNYGQSLQPVGPLLGMVADVVNLSNYVAQDEMDRVGDAAFLALKNSVGNATMLQGLTDFFKVFDSEQGFLKFTQSFAASNVPTSGLMGNVGAALDPYQREVYGMLDAIKARIPGVRETLNPKRDSLGAPVPESDKLIGGVLPVKSTEVNTNKVQTEMARLGIGRAKPDDHVDLKAGGDRALGKVELTQAERDNWSVLYGQQFERITAGTVSSELWDGLPDQVKKNIFGTAKSKASEYANKLVLTPERMQTEYNRIGEGVQKNYAPPLPKRPQ